MTNEECPPIICLTCIHCEMYTAHKDGEKVNRYKCDITLNPVGSQTRGCIFYSGSMAQPELGQADVYP